jgi:hypothetical protein
MCRCCACRTRWPATKDRLTDEDLRAEIQAHAERSAKLLPDCGFADTLCVEVVRLHHDDRPTPLPLAELSPAQQLARLLRRVDVFAAQISLRASRPPVSPVTAAREACLAAAGLPDEIGGALLRAVGLYPPGQLRRTGQRRDRHRGGARAPRQSAAGGGVALPQRQPDRRAAAARHDGSDATRPSPPCRRPRAGHAPARALLALR